MNIKTEDIEQFMRILDDTKLLVARATGLCLSGCCEALMKRERDAFGVCPKCNKNCQQVEPIDMEGRLESTSRGASIQWVIKCWQNHLFQNDDGIYKTSPELRDALTELCGYGVGWKIGDEVQHCKTKIQGNILEINNGKCLVDWGLNETWCLPGDLSLID